MRGARFGWKSLPARKGQICLLVQSDSGCPDSCAKTMVFHFSGDDALFHLSRLHRRGASRSSRTWEAGCDGRFGFGHAHDASRRRGQGGRAKACGPDPATLGSSLADDESAWRGWQESPFTQESALQAVNTIAQGRPVISAEPVVTAACYF